MSTRKWVFNTDAWKKMRGGVFTTISFLKASKYSRSVLSENIEQIL